VPVFRFRLFEKRGPRPFIDDALGVLERKVLELLWSRGALNVREACEHFADPIAYTTMMTTMDRLYKKGILGRQKQGRAFLYQAMFTREALDHRVAAEVMQGALDRNLVTAMPVLSSLVDAVTDRDARLLDMLDDLVQRKRRELHEQEQEEEPT
jgi:predicted transcriptional regulator